MKPGKHGSFEPEEAPAEVVARRDDEAEDGELRNLLIGDDKKAKEENKDDGCLILTLSCGDELGEINITTQFEGQSYDKENHGQWERCQAGQNRMLLVSAAMVRQIFEELGGPDDWIADVTSVRHPNADMDPCPEEALKILVDSKIDVNLALQNQWTIDSKHLNDVRAAVDVTHKPAHEIRRQSQHNVGIEHRPGKKPSS
jgi:hypothetical protein